MCIFRPSLLDNFALLSGQLNTLGKLLRNDKVPPLRNSVLLPIALSGDRDPELEVNIPCFKSLSLYIINVCVISCNFFDELEIYCPLTIVNLHECLTNMQVFFTYILNL